MHNFSVYAFLVFAVSCSFVSCSAKTFAKESVQKNVIIQQAEADSEMEKLDSVLAGMSDRFKADVKISDKNAFLKDLKVILDEDKKSNPEDLSLFSLIDKKHFVGKDYVPANLIHLENNEFYKVNKNSLSLRPEAYNALTELAKAACKDGVKLTISSTYRSYEYQDNLFNYWVSVDGIEEAERESARPGTSQHQLGCALDFAPVDDAFAQTEEGKWVYKNAGTYGWSLSFPQNYEDVTGYRWESWHFRYIGVNACNFQKKYFADVQQFMIEFIDEWKKS